MKPNKLIRANYQQILFVVIAFLAMVLVSYFYVSDIVRKQMTIIGDSSMDCTQTAVSAGLTEAELLFAHMVQSVESMLASEKSTEEIQRYLRNTQTHFSAARSRLPDFMKIYGYIRGEFIYGSPWAPPADYVPAQRPWYVGAENNNGTIFLSDPYLDVESGGMCISFSQKIFAPDGSALGVLAIDLKLSQITDYVSRQQIAGNGYGVLVDNKMKFITHRDKQLMGVELSHAGGDYPKLARMLVEEHPISALRFIDADSTDSIIFFRTIFNGWRLGIIIPRADYYEQVYCLAAVLGLMGLALMAALSVMLVRSRTAKMRSDEENLSKSSFLARMSHEMRTPMNAIIGMADIAHRSGDPQKVSYCLDKIRDASRHLLGVINDVLDMSKIEAGKLELSPTEFSFTSLIRQVETVVGHKMEEKRQRFIVTLEEDVPATLIGDQQRLAQVITNLLSNANKFTPEGGTISLHARTITGSENSCSLQIDVADNGIGISKQQQEKLFRAFEQADGSISRRYGGTGLGLAISQKILELMGGRIRVVSELGKGARFSFAIPIVPGTSPQEECTEESAHKHDSCRGLFAGKHILLAEDVALNREVVISLLEHTGISIDCAENGLVACKLFAGDVDKYAMIFMDIHMPVMDGYEATARIRGMDIPRAKVIPIVAMTANVFREDIEKCRAAGMDGHVGKPLEMNGVLAILQKYLP